MKKLIAALLLANFAGFGLFGGAAHLPAPFGLAGAIAKHSPLGLVNIAYADNAPTPPPAGHADTTQMAPAEVTKWLAFFDKLVTTVVNTQTACDKMAVDVSSVMDSNKDAIEIAKNAKAQGRKLPDDAKAKMVDGVKKMLPGMQNCGQNQKVRAAFAKLDLTHR
jgi:hypothetical protein